MENSGSPALTYAGFWSRVWASIIDTFLFALIIIPAVLMIYGVDEYLKNERLFLGTADFVLQMVLPAVAVIAFWVYKSATPGKMAIHARIVDARTGAPASTGQLVGRYLGYYLSLIPLGLGFIWVAFDAKKQGFHDKLAGTVVVRDEQAALNKAVFDTAR
jgi:uncharacterized RDD family membrane protein YckC